jgi:hypothetical protein
MRDQQISCSINVLYGSEALQGHGNMAVEKTLQSGMHRFGSQYNCIYTRERVCHRSEEKSVPFCWTQLSIKVRQLDDN